MNNQKGSILIWIIIAIFILATLSGAGWLYMRSQENTKLAEELANDRVLPTETEPEQPKPSPDYSLAKDTYNLNDAQLEILSNVVDENEFQNPDN